MTKRMHKKILAIDPGTREMGVAFLDSGKLIYHGVKTFAKQGSPHERLRIIRKEVLRLINDFRPDTLVVEKTFFARNRNAALLNVVGDEVQAIGKRKGLRVCAFAPNTVKKAICGNGHASKQEVATVVVSQFPQLKVYLDQSRLWKERYHANMFDAVALALMARGTTRY